MQLGRHKIGKACLYIRRLSDVQLPVLEQLMARSIAETSATDGPDTWSAYDREYLPILDR